MQERKQCVICESSQLIPLHTFKNFPMLMGISADNDKFYDQVWVICKNCGCIQLQYLIDLNELYSIPHNPAVGNMWKLHHEKFAKYVGTYANTSILEIGGGNFIIANLICENEPKIKEYLVYDMNVNYTENINKKIKIENKIFTENEKIEKDIDTIVISHTFEHFYDLYTYCNKFNNVLPIGGKLIISLPHIKNWLIDNFTSALQFEHTYLIDEKNIEYLLSKCGFKLIHIDWFSKYNMFVTFEKQIDINSIKLINNYKENLKLYKKFLKFQTKNIENINKKLNKYKDYDHYIFSCHVFTQFMLHFGLNETTFKGILDNDINKQNHRLYGTNLMTFNPSIIKDINKPCVIVQAGVYTSEISEQLIKLNKNVKLIT